MDSDKKPFNQYQDNEALAQFKIEPINSEVEGMRSVDAVSISLNIYVILIRSLQKISLLAKRIIRALSLLSCAVLNPIIAIIHYF